MHCSNCGQELASDAKFCSNCGAPVQAGASGSTGSSDSSPSGSERDWGGYNNVEDSTPRQDERGDEISAHQSADQSYDGEGGFADRKPTWEVERDRLRSGDLNDEWSMSDLGPARPPRRRTWLWVLLGMITLMIVACCVFMFWVTFTESGGEWLETSATQVAGTVEAMTPTPDAEATPQD